MKKLLFLLSVASLVNAMDEQKQAPKEIRNMGDHFDNRNDQAIKEWAEYAADCGCLAPFMTEYLESKLGAEAPEFVCHYLNLGFMGCDPKIGSFFAGFGTAQLYNYLPTWATVTTALGTVGAAKLIERKFNKVKALKNKKAE